MSIKEIDKKDILERYPNKSIKTIDFIYKAEKKFGKDHFDFKETEIKGTYEEKVRVYCTVHRETILICPSKFLNCSDPCEKCRLDKILDVDRDFLNIARNDYPDKSYKSLIIIGNLYKIYGRDNIDCSRVDYINCNIPIKLFCKKHNIWVHRSYTSLRVNCSNGLCRVCQKELNNRNEHYIKYGSEKDLINIPEDLKLEFPDKSEKTLGFIFRARNKFGKDRFDFSNTDYTSFDEKLSVRCLIHNVEYEVSPKNFLGSSNGGCKLCKMEDKLMRGYNDIPEEYFNISKEMYPKKDFITLLFISKSIYLLGEENINRFDFSKTTYISQKDEIIITCSKHNQDICITPKKFLSSIKKNRYWCLCQKCREESIPSLYRKDEELISGIEELKVRYPEKTDSTLFFIDRVESIFGHDRFDFSLTNYTRFCDEVVLSCLDHGITFKQKAKGLLGGHCACPECVGSKGERRILSWLIENEIESFIPSYGIKIEENQCYIDFKVIYNDKEFWIEFNGEQHYKPVDRFGGEIRFLEYQIPRDIAIKNYCKANNITLIVISYKEFDNIDSILTNIFLSDENKT